MPSKKEINRSKLLKYLSDPENEFLTRIELAVAVLGYKDQSGLYKTLSPAELDEIEAEAYLERNKRSSRQSSKILSSLYNEGIKGNVQAAKEWLDRVQGKVTEKHENKIDMSDMVMQIVGVEPKGDE